MTTKAKTQTPAPAIQFTRRAVVDRDPAKFGPKGRKRWRSSCGKYVVEELRELMGVVVPPSRRFIALFQPENNAAIILSRCKSRHLAEARCNSHFNKRGQ